MPYLRQSTVQTIRFGPFLDAGDGVTEEVALTITQALRRISKDGGAFAQSAHTGNSVHDSDGWYNDDLDATDTNTVGELILNVQVPATHLPVWMRWWVLEEAIYDLLFGAAATGLVTLAAVTHTGATVPTVTTLTNLPSIPANWLTAAGINADAITAAKVAAGTIDAATFAAGAINAAAIATDAITAAKIAANAIGASELATDAIGSAQLAANAIGAAEIADGAIDAATFAAGAINAAAIASNAITSAKFALDAINNTAIAGGAIGDLQIANSAVHKIQSLVGFHTLATSAAGTTTTLVDATLTQADDFWNHGALVVFTSGTNTGQVRLATDFVAATDTLTFAPAVALATANLDTYDLIPWGNAVLAGLTHTGAVVPTVTTLTGHTAQTGDSFARIGATGSGLTSLAQAAVLGALADAAAGGDPTATDTLMQYAKQLINILVGTAGVVTFPAEAAPANAVSLAEVLSAIHADVTGLAGATMRGTDSAALATVLGALADAAAAGDPTATDTVVAYTKQLINTLEGAVGIPVFPASADPANNVSIAESVRAIRDDVTGIAGNVMRGTDSALLAASAPTNFGDLSITATTGRVDLAAWLGVAVNALINGRVAAEVASRYKKNTATNNITFLMLDDVDHVTPEAGHTVAGTRSLDGAAFGAVTGTIAAIANGLYQIDASQADMNADDIVFRFTATGADDTFLHIRTAA